MEKRSTRAGVASRAEAADANAQLDAFMAKFSPEIAARAKATLREMRKLYPTALELVYDNYNALAIGFAPSERASEAIFSIALYPKWVSLFLLQGAGLADPKGILKGSGKVVRYVVLSSPQMVHDPDVQALMHSAVEHAKVPFDPAGKHRLIIKSVSEKQQPRQPAAALTAR
jgi:hypothetical protein